MFKIAVAIATVLLGTALAAEAETSAQKAAEAALIAYQQAHGGKLVAKIVFVNGAPSPPNGFMKPFCYVVQSWAQCTMLIGDGDAWDWLKLKNGKWTFVDQGGGAYDAAAIEQDAGVPAAIAKQFAACQLKSNCR
jgi:hypothetical protein